jgi:hypothetical protein
MVSIGLAGGGKLSTHRWNRRCHIWKPDQELPQAVLPIVTRNYRPALPAATLTCFSVWMLSC